MNGFEGFLEIDEAREGLDARAGANDKCRMEGGLQQTSTAFLAR